MRTHNGNGHTADATETLDLQHPVNVDINDDSRADVAEGLRRFVADTHALHLKALNYHWHVKGMHFMTLHEFFEELYNDLHASLDDVAERVLQLGWKAPATHHDMIELTTIKPGDDSFSAEEMLHDLLTDYEGTIGRMRSWRQDADAADDAATVAMFDDRLAEFEKRAWMMRSLLG